jgi:O-methyltransferase
MVSFANFWYLLSSIDYLVENGISGSFVECGVWRGGSAMTMAMRLAQLKATNVDIYLFDTYAGMVEPSSFDVEAQSGELASDLLKYASNESYIRALAPLSLVKSNMERTKYLMGKIHFIEGDVLETLPIFETGDIALPRLDTDWYESTLAELKFLFPRLVKGGVCIIDDYGHWEGSRRAVDEFFETEQFKPLLFEVDYTCRAFI